jgi:hypothetical protein
VVTLGGVGSLGGEVRLDCTEIVGFPLGIVADVSNRMGDKTMES